MVQLRVNYKSGKPVHLQLMEQVKAAAASGALRPGEPLPSIASVSQELRVNRNAVARAYSEMEMLGLLEMLPEKGYCLREQHRPVRKAVRRTLGGEQAIAPAPRADATSLRHSISIVLLGILYLILLGGIAILMIRKGVIQGEMLAVLATVCVAAVLLPVFGLVQRHLDSLLLAKREVILQALRHIKAEALMKPGLDSFMELVISESESLLGARLELVHERATVLSLIDSFPLLRSEQSPLSAGNEVMMPVFVGDEVFGVLRVTGKTTGWQENAETMEFLSTLSEQVAMFVNQSRMRSERLESEYALDIQRGLLPREVPQLSGFTIAGAWQPSRNVGGDYYDVFKLSDTQMALVIADVSGKGMPAALLMSNVQATAKAFATSGATPKELCTKVNRSISDSITAGKFVTFFYALLDAENLSLTYTNAGHNPPLLVSRERGCQKLGTGGAVLGIFADGSYEQACTGFLPGDRLVMFTDGITEATGPDGSEFGEERLSALLLERSDASAAGLRDAIMQHVTQFCQGDFADDATL